MDPIRNPFAPGAGTPPPELAGRETILSEANIALQRALIGKTSQSQILIGLRGVGKTVLLNEIEQLAQGHHHLTSYVEAPENRQLPELLYPRIFQVLRKLSTVEKAKRVSHLAMRALRSFASTFTITMGDLSISVDPEPGLADSGNLEQDLSELFQIIGRAAQAAGRGWSIFIDELQYLSERDYAALIVALHRCQPEKLPILIFGAGLPQIAALSGDAKSYAERLFIFQHIGPLDEAASNLAIKRPIEDEGESITQGALQDIYHATQGYPFFLQEWGYQAWNAADESPIDRQDIAIASKAAFGRLDASFFKVRFDRLTPKEREYILAMARLGPGPYRSADVAEILGEKLQTLGPRRANIIRKGMIYSPEHGDIDFTVPMFDDYLRRTFLSRTA